MRNTHGFYASLCTGLLLSGTAAFAQPSEARPEQTERANASDQEFLTRALHLNALELELGSLASDRGNSPDVKMQGRNMMKKHAAFGRELSEQARRNGVVGTQEMTPAQQGVAAQLEQMSGPAFDSAFKATIDQIHQQELAMYENEAAHASDHQLRAFAQTRVEALQKLLNK